MRDGFGKSRGATLIRCPHSEQPLGVRRGARCVPDALSVGNGAHSGQAYDRIYADSVGGSRAHSANSQAPVFTFSGSLIAPSAGLLFPFTACKSEYNERVDGYVKRAESCWSRDLLYIY